MMCIMASKNFSPRFKRKIQPTRQQHARRVIRHSTSKIFITIYWEEKIMQYFILYAGNTIHPQIKVTSDREVSKEYSAELLEFIRKVEAGLI